MSIKRKIFLFLTILGSIGCTEVFEENISDENVLLISPGPGITTQISNQIFFWDEVEQADWYDFQLVTPDFDSVEILIHAERLDVNRKELSLNPGVYEWRVRALNNTGATEYVYRSFNISSINDSLKIDHKNSKLNSIGYER